MREDLQDLTDRLPHLSDEELLRIAVVDSEQYRHDALVLVQEELHRRNLSDISKDRHDQLRVERERREAAGSRKLPRWMAWANPTIDNVASARRAAKQGMVAALVVAGATSLMVLLGALGVGAIAALGFNAYALADVAVFAAIAYGISRGSRFAAFLGLVAYIGNQVYLWSASGHGFSGLAALLILAFMNGLRGTIALNKYLASGVAQATRPLEPL